MTFLVIEGLSVHFGGLQAVADVSLAVERGEIRGIIGPNGAGKTTLFNAISGIVSSAGGRITLNGTDLRRLAPHALAGAGLSRTFQNVMLFGNLSAVENVMVGCHAHLGHGVLSEAVGLGRARADEVEFARLARDLLDEVGLAADADRRAVDLPFGQQRLLEVARALAARPQILMLDEPSAGLSAAEADGLADLLRRLRRERGLTVLLVEHNMRLVMDLCDRISVLNYGRKIAEGTPDEVRADPGVVEAYLGREYAAAAP